MEQFRSGALQPLVVEWAVPAPGFKVVYPSGRYLTAKVRAFTEFVAEVYPMKGWWDEVVAMTNRGGRKSGGRPPNARKPIRR